MDSVSFPLFICLKWLARLNSARYEDQLYVRNTQSYKCCWRCQRLVLIKQARSQGGVGGVVRPPPVAHPKDFVPPFSNFVPPFSNFVPPFSNFVPPFSNFVPPFSNFVPPFSNFVPPFSNFVPPLENGWRHTGNVQGGVLMNVQEWGRFSNWWRHADNVQGGGAPGVPPIQVQTPPTWLAGYGPVKGHLRPGTVPGPVWQ